MRYSYIAYIDEFGDDGLANFVCQAAPGVRPLASDLGAYVALFSDLEAVKWRNEITAGMPAKKTHALHFKDLNYHRECSRLNVFQKDL